MLTPVRLEVWGDPIAHSLSPVLHTAAYRALGLDWEYDRRQVSAEAFAATLDGPGSHLRGLSLTMPLKDVAFRAADVLDRRATLTGAVNTFVPEGRRGYNTDVGGIVRSVRQAGIDGVETARIVGAGATARSALVALAELGARDVDVASRRPGPVVQLAELGASLDVRVTATPLDAATFAPVPLTLATLPGGVALDPAVAGRLAAAGGFLSDAVYGHWPTELARAWEALGAPAQDGLGMLLHQALLQVRVFVAGDPDRPLPGEDDVLAAMRHALA
ncbi:shikimate dehydrogenase [Microbacterium sp. X-17]|uniref:shikimate dehydrogenase n=1 Tax=Microbacterium sp. X-17 TaxID=3144404 RepID=UPI0031F56DC3